MTNFEIVSYLNMVKIILKYPQNMTGILKSFKTLLFNKVIFKYIKNIIMKIHNILKCSLFEAATLVFSDYFEYNDEGDTNSLYKIDKYLETAQHSDQHSEISYYIQNKQTIIQTLIKKIAKIIPIPMTLKENMKSNISYQTYVYWKLLTFAFIQIQNNNILKTDQIQNNNHIGTIIIVMGLEMQNKNNGWYHNNFFHKLTDIMNKINMNIVNRCIIFYEICNNLILYNRTYHNQILEHDINATNNIIKSTYDTINTILNPQVKAEPKNIDKKKWIPTDELYTIAESIYE
jgi:hypothetical protein